MILDILKPDSGQINVLGGPLDEDKKNRIGYMPEERGLYRNVQVLDLLTYLGRLKGMSTADVKQRAHDLLARLDLSEWEDKKLSALSKGMSQKVQFIATIIHRPKLLIVDEPFSGLDPVNTQALKDMVFELAKDGTTIVMSTHVMHQVEEMGDRLLMLDHGKPVLYGAVQDVRNRFAEHAVVVEGEGDWQALPSVSHVEAEDNGRSVRLHLADGVSSDQLMQALATNPAYHVRSFTLAVPSLNDIFIQVAGRNGNHA
jgi:ABC-2 type transport system ATP-binding protein